MTRKATGAKAVAGLAIVLAMCRLAGMRISQARRCQWPKRGNERLIRGLHEGKFVMLPFESELGTRHRVIISSQNSSKESNAQLSSPVFV